MISTKDCHDGIPVTDRLGGQAQKRNRTSIAQLLQYSVEYRGRFIDNRLNVQLGLRAPDLSRDLHQYCYSQIGS